MRPIKRLAQAAAWCALTGFATSSALAGDCVGTQRQVDTSSWNANTKVYNETSQAVAVVFQYQLGASATNPWREIKSIASLAPGEQIGVTLASAKGDAIRVRVFAPKALSSVWVECTYATRSASKSDLGAKRTYWANLGCPETAVDTITSTCEKSWNRGKSRWNTKIRLEDA